jgi:P-type conjugative transfer protein TrbG
MMKFAQLGFAAPFAALGMTACAAQTMPKHETPFQQAVVAPNPPLPEKIVTVPQPLPLPGQLEPPPTVTQERLKPQSRVEIANQRALQEPASGAYLNAIQVYPYSVGALYRLYAAPQEVSDIALQPGETLTAISAGDTVRWVVGDTTSGVGVTKQVHILAKPFTAGLKTNLVITTDRRSYHLQLESTDRTYMAAVSWTYPDDELIALKKQNDEATRAAPVDTGIALSDLHFDYVIGGDNPPWKPVRAFDDGKHVYIEFPAAIAQGDAPPLFLKGEGGTNELVNYRVHDNYYIVDQLFAVAELRLGTDPQQTVRIRKKPGLRVSDARP